MRTSTAAAPAHRGSAGATLRVRGEVDLASAADLEAQVLSLIRSGAPSLRLDLSGVTFMDCSGLGVLLNSRNTATLLGIEFRLLSASCSVARLMQLALGQPAATTGTPQSG